MLISTQKSTLKSRPACLLGLAGAILVFGPQNQSSAASLDLQNMPASDAAGQLEKAFNVQIDIKPGIDLHRQVTLHVPDTGAKDALLNSINSFATAIGADFRKEFIITPALGNQSPQLPSIDELDAHITFDDESQMLSKSINAVALVDDASVKVSTPLQPYVTFTSRRLSIKDAILQLEGQTHTQWNVGYLITPHTGLNSSPGRVVGYTSVGRPIIELLTVKFPGGALPSAGADMVDAVGSNLDGTQPTPISQGQAQPMSPDQLQGFIYRSAFARGDISAMKKFQNGSPSGPTQQPGQ